MMAIGPRIKMVFGALLALLGIWWYIPGSDANIFLMSYSTMTNWNSLVAMIQGSLGIIAVIIGVFVAWIEHDQIKVQKELKSESFGERVQHSVKAVAEGAGRKPEPDKTDENDGDEKQESDSDESEFVCDDCERSFDTKRGLGVHRSQAH